MKRKDTYLAGFFKLLKWAVGLLLCWHVYVRLSAEGGWSSWQAGWAALPAEGLWYAIWAVLLMPVNLGLEVAKWRWLLRPAGALGWWLGYRAVASGLTLGIFTPGRFGEFAGRVLYVPEGQRLRAGFATVVGGFAGLWAILLCFLPLAPGFFIDLGWLPAGRHVLWHGLAYWSMLVLVLVFFALGRLTAWLRVWPWLARWRSVFEAMGAFGRRDLAVLLGLALLRFAVVCFQLQLFWWAFDLPLAGAEPWARSIELFALQASLPGFVWTDLGVRGSVALWLLADYSADAWRLVGPSFALWLLNVIVPALLGWVSLWFVKWRDVVR